MFTDFAIVPRWERTSSNGHAKQPSSCQHPYDGRYLCAIDRRKRPASRQLRTTPVLQGFTGSVEKMGLQGRNIRRPAAISAKLDEEVLVSVLFYGS